jgi:hypothetical protein
MKGMAMTIVETRVVTGGVDTHLDTHVAAALDNIGGLLGVESFATTPAGYEALSSWLWSFGTLGSVGVEGTGSYGAGLARYLHAAGVKVVEVNRADRASRPSRASPTPSTRCRPLELRCRDGPAGSPKDATAASRPSAP